ncbi:hypothetical protein STEG23_001539, partial [Scotinomys teguina]
MQTSPEVLHQDLADFRVSHPGLTYFWQQRQNRNASKVIVIRGAWSTAHRLSVPGAMLYICFSVSGIRLRSLINLELVFVQ